jgi:hypothetical protein
MPILLWHLRYWYTASAMLAFGYMNVSDILCHYSNVLFETKSQLPLVEHHFELDPVFDHLTGASQCTLAAAGLFFSQPVDQRKADNEGAWRDLDEPGHDT